MIKKQQLYGAILTLCLIASCGTNPSKESSNSSVEANPSEQSLYFKDEVPYQENAKVTDEIVAECELEKNVIEGLHKRSGKNGLPISESINERELFVTISHATPGLFSPVLDTLVSRHSVLGLWFKVIEDGEELYKEHRTCSTKMSGVLGRFAPACSKLEKCAREQGKYIADKLMSVLYKTR